MSDDAFGRLQDRLSEMQIELIRREWDGDLFRRADAATSLRDRLWQAIADYRDAWCDVVRPCR